MPARREVLAALCAYGLSAGTASGAETAGPAQAEEPFATDFDHPASALDEHGWTVEHGSFGTEDSYLVADGGAANLDYQLSRPQPSPAGTFEFRGVRNEHPFYGLRFAFVSDSRSFGEPPVAGGTQRGYQIVLRNTQNGGEVELERTDGDGAESLLTLAEDHGGALTDVRIERDPDTWEFHCYLDGEHVGSVHDDTYTDSSYWVQKHGAGDSQRVDGVGMPAAPNAPVPREQGFDTDFDFPTARLDEEGWRETVGSFRTRDSHLVSDGRGGDIYNVAHEQPTAAGVFEMRGVQNTATFYGLKSVFVSDADVREGARGYMIRWVQARYARLELVRIDGEDGGEVILELAGDHGGRPTDVRVERDPETWEFDCYLDGEHVGSVHDDTYTTSRYWVQRHDAGAADQRVDGLSARPAGADGPSSPDGTTTTASTPGSADEDHAWLENWTPLFAWLVGVPLLGPLVLAILVAATDRHSEEPSSADSEGEA